MPYTSIFSSIPFIHVPFFPLISKFNAVCTVGDEEAPVISWFGEHSMEQWVLIFLLFSLGDNVEDKVLCLFSI